MSLATVILLVLALFFVQIFLQEVSAHKFNPGSIVGNRDAELKLGVVAKRLDRAKNNMLEALPLFLGVALAAFIKKEEANILVTNGAILFLAARAIYVPIYAAGIPVVRSIVWLAGIAGMLMMAWPMVG